LERQIEGISMIDHFLEITKLSKYVPTQKEKEDNISHIKKITSTLPGKLYGLKIKPCKKNGIIMYSVQFKFLPYLPPYF